ncbi:MAG: sigma-E factor negative regulatory protein [Pseudomonadota bacterium]
MKTQTTSRLADLSALFDGETEAMTVRQVTAAARQEPELRDAWRAYALIGEQLRHEGHAVPDMTADIMDRIRQEPVVFAPHRLPAPTRQHPLLALAASVAGIAMVGWLALSGDSHVLPSGSDLAAVPPGQTFARIDRADLPPAAPARAAAETTARADMSEYLLAHQTQAANFRLGDSTEHVRTVSMSARPTHP